MKSFLANAKLELQQIPIEVGEAIGIDCAKQRLITLTWEPCEPTHLNTKAVVKFLD